MKFFAFPEKSPMDRLSLFVHLWAVASLIHLISFPEDVRLLQPISWLAGVAAVAIFIFPRSILLFILLLLFRIVDVAQWIPFVANHILFEFLLNIGMLLAVLWSVYRQWRRNESGVPDFSAAEVREKIYHSFAPMARVSLLLLYFFAVLHKLNWDYLNPAISCGTHLLNGIAAKRLPFLPEGEWVQLSAVWGTLFFEAGIPLLLLFRRTRAVGILIGMAFHFFLSIHPHQGIYSFSVLMFALYGLFVPPGFPARLQWILDRYVLSPWRQTPFVLRMLLVGTVLVLAVMAWINWQHKLYVAGFLYWSAWAISAMGIYAAVLWVSRGLGSADSKHLFRIPTKAFWLLPAIILLNGMSPYLGLKTESSFSMFSNLRTEGGKTNHLFIPNTVRLTNFQDDLVEVLETDAEEFQFLIERNQLITYFEFRRRASNIKRDFRTLIRRNGRTDTLVVKGGISSLPEYTSPHSWLLDKIFYFRYVDKEGPCTCMH